MAKVKADLDELALKSPEVTARFNSGAASAELAAFTTEVDRLDGRSINIDTSQGVGGLNLLLTAGLALGPALIPVAATIAAAFGAIGTGAILGIGGLGTLGLAFSGVGDAVKELGKTHTATGQSAAKSAAQQQSAANAVLSAQEGVRSAQIGLANAEDALKRSREQAAIAAQNASVQVDAAIRRQRQAELALIDSQRTALRAQLELTRARLDAQRALEDMAFSVQDNALAQRRARLDLQTATDNFALVDAPVFAGRQQDEAQLALDEAQQRLTELEVQGKRLAADKADADKAGVSGSRQVTAAQDAIVAANERVAQAQEQVRLSADAVTKAQVDGARQVDLANQSVIQGERAVELANQSVGAAVRSVAQAQAQLGAQSTAAAPKVDKLAEAMGKLSPEGQHFARFVHDELRPRLKELQATAQAGLLPGVEQGIRNAMPQFGLLNDTVGIIAGTFGDLATRAGTALTDPFWTGFFTFIRDEAGPSTRIFGGIIGNLATGAAGLIQAFRPVWDEMGAGLLHLTERFANFGKDAAAGKSDSFNAFLAYVKEAAPQVKELLHQLTVLAGNLAQAFAGQGLSTLTVLNEFLRLVNILPPGTLRLLIDLFIAYKLLKLGVGIYGELSTVVKFLIGEDGILGALKKIKASGGLRGALLGGAGKVLGAASVVGAIGVADDATNGGVGKVLNTASGAPQAAPGTGSFSDQLGNLFSGNFSQAFGSGPAQAGDKWDIRNLPKTLTDAFADARAQLSETWSGIVGDATTKFGQLKGTVTSQSQGAAEGAKAPWYASPGWFSGIWSSIWAGAGAGWGSISGTIGGWAGNTWTTVTGWFSRLAQWLGGTWTGMWQGAQNAWNGIYSTITGVAQNTWNSVTGWFNRLGQDIANSWQWAIDRVRNIWNQLGDIAKRPVNFVIDWVYNRGIRGVWNAIAGTFGMGQLGPVPLLAAGGTIPVQAMAPMATNKPMAIVGEGGHHPEYVIPTDPKYRCRARSLWEQAGGQLMASGGILGAIESGWDWATGLFTDPAGTARRLFAGVSGLANQIPGIGGLHDALTRLPGKVIDAVVAAAKKLVATVGSAFTGGGGGAQRWSGIAAQVLAMLHQPASSLGALLRRIDFESGGRPNAINLTDSNARAGHPSQGLMQTIPSTFAAYAGPFRSRGILDPLANIYAGSNYAIHRYGSVAAVDPLVRPRGYDTGGWLPPGVSMAINGTGEYERVSTGPEYRELLAGAARSSTARTSGADLAVLSQLVGERVDRAMASFSGTLQIVDDGRNGLARIQRRQERSLAREG